MGGQHPADPAFYLCPQCVTSHKNVPMNKRSTVWLKHTYSSHQTILFFCSLPEALKSDHRFIVFHPRNYSRYFYRPDETVMVDWVLETMSIVDISFCLLVVVLVPLTKNYFADSTHIPIAH